MKDFNKPQSYRQQRVSTQLRQLISTLLIKDEFNLPIVKQKLISVVDVNISPDLKNARIYIAVNNENDTEIVNDLNKKSGYIKKKLSKDLKLKFFPNLSFYIDTSLEYSKNINNILKNIS